MDLKLKPGLVGHKIRRRPYPAPKDQTDEIDDRKRRVEMLARFWSTRMGSTPSLSWLKLHGQNHTKCTQFERSIPLTICDILCLFSDRRKQKQI